MKAFKLARMAYQQANIYRIPERFRESVEIATMHVHAKPFTDSEVSYTFIENTINNNMSKLFSYSKFYFSCKNKMLLTYFTYIT